MRVKVMSWAAWASNPANGTASCRVCEKTIRGLDFYEAEQLDAKGRRFICAGCVKEQGAEVVKDFGPLAEGPMPSRPLVELLPSHKAMVQAMIDAAMKAHEKAWHIPKQLEAPESEPPGGQTLGKPGVEPGLGQLPPPEKPKATRGKKRGKKEPASADA